MVLQKICKFFYRCYILCVVYVMDMRSSEMCNGIRYSFAPIGYVRCDARYTQETPRQGVFSRRSAVIELEKHCNYEAALQNLDGVSHIWIIWVFDRVNSWKPMVQPPTLNGKVGVFATRSPHRPNPIGITAAKLVKVGNLKIYVENIDLLDGTPVLDIKPYVSEADRIEGTVIGWKESEEFTPRAFSVSPLAEKQAQFITEHGNFDILETARVQLTTRILSADRQRLEFDGRSGMLAFRTWRIDFTADDELITVSNIRSGYSAEELLPDASDRYGDLELHRKFNAVFVS